MKKPFEPKQIKNTFEQFISTIKHIIDIAWPIRWSTFKKPKTILSAISQSSYALQVVVVICLVGAMVSAFFLSFGLFTVLTKEVPDNGGEVHEAVLTNMKSFNPVLELSTEAEKKASRLLFHPLYEVTLPDFINDKNGVPKINPVLLEKAPEWAENENPSLSPDLRFKTLTFKLKPNLKWTNNDPLTTDDVAYSFARIIENDKGNSDFRKTFKDVTFNKIDNLQFTLTSRLPNPQLLYLSNFSPISQVYFDNLNNDRLAADPRSSKPMVTSGYYTLFNGKVQDPRAANGVTKDNPIDDDTQPGYRNVVLTKNTNQNYNTPYINTYIFQKFSDIKETAGANYASLEASGKAGKIDVYTRNMGNNLNNLSYDSASMQKVLGGLAQTNIDNNTYFTLFTNSGKSINSKNSRFLINQSLRKYIFCSFQTFSLHPDFKDFVSILPQEERLLPLQLGKTQDMNCPANPEAALDDNYIVEKTNGSTKKVYLVDRNTKKKSTDITLSLLWSIDNQRMLDAFQNFLTNDVGITLTNTATGADASTALSSGDYDLAFTPITFASMDPYSLYGQNGLNISRLSSNSRIAPYNIESELIKYSASNLEDQVSNAKLTDFFSKEYISLNLLRGKTEINYRKGYNISTDGLAYITFNEELYHSLPSWYNKTKRQWNWIN